MNRQLSGDTIYADGPVLAQLTVEDGRIWRNITTEAKSKVAETLGGYLDENLRQLHAILPNN